MDIQAASQAFAPYSNHVYCCLLYVLVRCIISGSRPELCLWRLSGSGGAAERHPYITFDAGGNPGQGSLRNLSSTNAGTNTVIDLYTWTTPNGRKVSIALEELGLPYAAHAVDIGRDEQFKSEFLKISPNNRIPAIVDRNNGMSLMESGAILVYLADKTGKLLPKSGEARYRTIEWLMWQMGGPGPMFGQVHHFVKYNKGKAPYAEERFLKEAHRLYGVLDRRLKDREHVVDDYSIADIAIWPWVSRYEWQTVDLNQYPNVKRWYVAIAKRPATQKGYKVPKDVGEVPLPS
jgi:GST-like protein